MSMKLATKQEHATRRPGNPKSTTASRKQKGQSGQDAGTVPTRTMGWPLCLAAGKPQHARQHTGVHPTTQSSSMPCMHAQAKHLARTV